MAISIFQKTNAAKNVILGIISPEGSVLTAADMVYLTTAVNAFIECKTSFHLSANVKCVYRSLTSSHSFSKNRCEFFYSIIKNIYDSGAKINLKPYIVNPDVKLLETKKRQLKRKARNIMDAVERERAVVNAEKQQIQQMYAAIIENQQKEADAYFANLKNMRIYDSVVKNKRHTNENVVGELRTIYGDVYDYSKVIYKNSKLAVQLYCSKHKVNFERTLPNLRKGWGCPECNKEQGKTWKNTIACKYDKSRINSRWTTERFIQESETIFGKGVFDYSMCHYVNNDTKVTLRNTATNVTFDVMPYDHLRNGANYDGTRHYYEGKTMEERRHFIVRRIKERVKAPLFIPLQGFGKSKSKFKCVCPLHGKFFTTMAHINDGRGCPECDSNKGESIGEMHVRKYLTAKGIEYCQEMRVTDKKYFKTFIRVDFYLPNSNTIIEFNGEQHYGIANDEITHGNNTYNKQAKRDIQLRKYAADHDINLIEIPYVFRNDVATFLDMYDIF